MKFSSNSLNNEWTEPHYCLLDYLRIMIYFLLEFVQSWMSNKSENIGEDKEINIIY